MPNTSDLRTTDVERAAEAIRRGGLAAIPTETVYGLAADATNVVAVRRIFEVKGRPTGHPLIVHLPSPDALDRWSRDPSPAARSLAATAWPGPLTIIVPRPSTIPAEVAGGLDSVGLRVPAHPIAQRVLALCGTVLAAPSANRFGAVSPTAANHVLHDLGDRLDPAIDVVLDGGPSPIGVESTIVDCTVDPPQILRTGSVPADHVREIVGDLAPVAGSARASGMLSSHYAPVCAVRLVDSADDAFALRAGTPKSEILDLNDDLVVYARELYSSLRSADERGVGTVIAVLPPATGLGHAIRDRLTKAAAPRPHG